MMRSVYCIQYTPCTDSVSEIYIIELLFAIVIVVIVALIGWRYSNQK